MEVFKRYNLAMYPLQAIFVVLALVVIFLAVKPTPKSNKLISGILALLWIWMGVAYHLVYFSSINNAAYLFGATFIFQGIQFFYLGVFKNQLSFKFRSDVNGIIGFLILGYALIVYPLAGSLLGHSYPSNPTFGLPCPTTIFTFGILLSSATRLPLTILIIPLLWSTVGFQAAISFGFYEDIGLSLSGILAAFLLVFRNLLLSKSEQFSKLLKQFFFQSKNISQQKFSFAQISKLPSPVQRYFRLVLKEGQPYISYARLLHDGSFKTGRKKKWIDIKGEQYFTTSTPGFIWKGVTMLFTARDMYMDGEGSLVVSILSLFKVVDGKGAKLNQGELLRWLAEGVWFPTNLLPTEKLRWIEVGDLTAKLLFNHNGMLLTYIATFNSKGEITQLETKRYMSDENLETWIGKMSDYKEISGVVIPTSIEAIWRLADEDFSYAKFFVKQIEYDIPEEWPNAKP